MAAQGVYIGDKVIPLHEINKWGKWPDLFDANSDASLRELQQLQDTKLKGKWRYRETT